MIRISSLLRNRGWDVRRLGPSRLSHRLLEHDLPRLVSSLNPQVFDVGANKGQSIELFNACFGASRIVAFEPNPDLHEKLRKKYEPAGVLVENAAVGSSCGELPFRVMENDELSSVLEVDPNAANPFASAAVARIVRVPVITVDHYSAVKGIDRIDLLKIDTQGFDLEVLRGAKAILSSQRVDVILVEVNFVPLYRGQCTVGEIERFLAAHGYGLVDLYEVVRFGGCIRWATACFIRIAEAGA